MPPERTQLNSWKEIASYLDVSVRTAQLWEKERGMPVRRLPNEKDTGRGRVFAYADELQEWLDSGPDTSGITDPGTESVEATVPPSRQRLRWAAAGAIATLAVVALYFGLGAALFQPEPAGWTVANDTLVVTDIEGNELWRRNFGVELYETAYDAEQVQPKFLDLDGDGSTEVLFVVASADTRRSYWLTALSATGETLWNFTPGGEVRTLTEGFENTYVIAQVESLELGPADSRGIAVVSHQIAYYPTQIVVLSSAGVVDSEYWHAGRIGVNTGSLRIADMDADGVSEIYAGGVSNARNLATLVVLDPREMAGASMEDRVDYQFMGMARGHEIGRVFFPRSPVSLASRTRYNVVTTVLAGPDDLTVGTIEDATDPSGPGLHYRLSPDLAVLDVSENDGYGVALARLPESERAEAEFLATLAQEVVVERSANP